VDYQCHASAAFPIKTVPVPTVEETVWAPELVETGV
jgi:hypothetical protein